MQRIVKIIYLTPVLLMGCTTTREHVAPLPPSLIDELQRAGCVVQSFEKNERMATTKVVCK